MNKEYFDKWAKEVAPKNGVEIVKSLVYGTYYKINDARSAVYEIVWQGHKLLGILKLFDDPRITYEIGAHQAFNAVNKSQILRAPKIIHSEQITPHKGWILMEKIPDGYKQLPQPLPKEKRYEFLKLYGEYKRNAPKRPHRPLTLEEKLSAEKFHLSRILGRWLRLANDKQEKEQVNYLDRAFCRLFENALDAIEAEFKGRKMIWSVHGLFKPEDIFEVERQGKKEYYLIDFCRAGMHPQGYELSTIVWADWIISADWRMSYLSWVKGIEDWRKKIMEWNFKQPSAHRKNAKNLKKLLEVCLIERILGTILADVCASDRPKEEKEARLSYLIKYLNEIIKNTG